ncbi:lipopolysaccharide biosynthesis protein [Devosia yakushimensis]|uniref:Lipopolysaccharide biosynthesis protein n=1 Tax=Devosia yakushimensis TaxID=470028 RepID=A0ABQ5U9H5_9HYPH|nr:lipopolysaccharide biosynthesis protein [Devosia yakushimensis]GLQ08293.1 lipopolysaccharide biosynthesis protein [Devosia yakushimensis]
MNFKRQFVVSAFWSSIGNGASSLISFVVFALVVHLVEAEAVGIVAFAMVFIVFGRVFVEAGTHELILRRKEFDDRYASVAFWLSLAISAIAVLLFALILAPLIDRVFAPGSGIVLTVLSLSFLVDGSRVVHEAKFRRDFKYRELAIRYMAGTLVSGIVGVWAAYAGYGVWALVAQRLVASLVTTAVTWFSSTWRPSLLWSREFASEQIVHGVGLLGASTLKIIIQRVPEVALGLAQGPLSVAIYGVGIRTYEALYQLTAFPLLSAAMSSFARLPDRESLAKAYVSTTGFFSTFSFPLFFGMAVIAEQLVPLLFGPKWQTSGFVLMALAVSAPPSVLGVLLHPVLNALGRTALIFKLNLGSAIVMLAACAIFAAHGPVVVAIVLAIRIYLGLACILFVLKREVGIDPRAILLANAPPFFSSLAMLAAAIAIRHILPHDLPTILVLAALVLTGAVTYMAVMILAFPRHSAQVAQEASEMFPGLKRFARPLLRAN